MMISRHQVKKIQKLRNELRMTKDEFDNLLENLFKVNTCLYINRKQADRLINCLKSLRPKHSLNPFNYIKTLLKAI